MKFASLILGLLIMTLLQGAGITGYVSDAGDGERIGYANVRVKGSTEGVITSKEGYFGFSELSSGEYVLEIWCVGYRMMEYTLYLEDDLSTEHLKVELEREAIKLEGQSVGGHVKARGLSFSKSGGEINLGRLALKGELIQSLPQAADADVIRSMEILPGVQSMNETSNGLYVRGGTPDQNQILLDNTEVYNPSHLGGIFSTFNSDAISRVDLYKSGFPSRYGDRLSSVVDISNKDGNRKRFSGILRISALSGSATLESPWQLFGTRGSWMGSFRRTLYEVFDYDMPTSHFYDGHIKINWDGSIKDKVFISSYFGEDHLEMNEGEKLLMDWGNRTYSGQWLHVFSSSCYNRLNISSSKFHFDLEQIFDEDSSMEQENKIDDLSLKSDLNYKLGGEHEIESGLEIKRLEIIFGATTNIDIDESHYPWLEVPSWQVSAYLQDIYKLGESWTIQPGLRYTWCKTESKYHPEGGVEDYFRLSPRLALRKKLGKATRLSLSYGRYYQYLTATNRSDWPMTLWMPIDKSVEPGEADHFVAGLQSWLGELFEIELECYYKDLRNQVSINEDAFLEWEDGYYLGDAYKTGDGYAYGGELLISSQWDGLEGFLSYSYSSTRLKVKGVNEDPSTGEAQYYHPRHDRTHSVNLVQNFNYGKQTGNALLGGDLTLGLVYCYGSGQPHQAPEAVYEDEYGLQFVDGYLDNERLPAYQRLDLSLKLLWELENYSIEPYFMVVNVLDARNVWTRSWYAQEQEDELLLSHKDTYMFGRMPFVGININW